MNSAKENFHTFPGSVEAFEKNGSIVRIVGGDGIERLQLEIPGWYKGHYGVFEFMKEPNNAINHRFFRSIK